MLLTKEQAEEVDHAERAIRKIVFDWSDSVKGVTLTQCEDLITALAPAILTAQQEAVKETSEDPNLCLSLVPQQINCTIRYSITLPAKTLAHAIAEALEKTKADRRREG